MYANPSFGCRVIGDSESTREGAKEVFEDMRNRKLILFPVFLHYREII